MFHSYYQCLQRTVIVSENGMAAACVGDESHPLGSETSAGGSLGRRPRKLKCNIKFCCRNIPVMLH